MKKIIGIVVIVVLLVVFFWYINKNKGNNTSADAGDLDSPTANNDQGIKNQSEQSVQNELPATSVTITNSALKEFNFSMVAGTKKLEGSSHFFSKPPNGSLTSYGSGWIYVLKNQVAGDYRFVIMQWLPGYNPNTGNYDNGVPNQTNFYIIPVEYGFNVDMAVDKGYIDWNSNQYVEVI